MIVEPEMLRFRMIQNTWGSALGESANGRSVSHPEDEIWALADEITTLAAHLGAAEFRLLRAIGEFDAREGWGGVGIASCAHWLNWRCGISLPAGREKVRVARALRALPETSAAMARGELSYSKVRAITRVATLENEQALVTLGRKGTAHHLEETIRRYRTLRRLQDAEHEVAKQQARELRYHWDDDGMLVLHARLPAEQGALVLKAIEAAAEALRPAARGEDVSAETRGAGEQDVSAETRGARERDVSAETRRPIDGPRGADASFGARRADAFVLMAETLLVRGAAGLSPGERHQVVVHVDAGVLADDACEGRAEVEDGPPLAVETIRRLLCDGSIVPMRDDADGNPLDVGRRTRAIPPALRRALKSRDGGCRFPGCTNRRWADGHHVEHWADGGETKLDNLVMLCRLHHRLVHEDGFTVARVADGAFVFRAPDGRRVEEVPARRLLAADPVLALVAANAALGITPRTCVPEWFGERPDYHWMVGALRERDRASAMR